MATGKLQHTNGQENRDSTTVDIDNSPPFSRADVPPPAYSSASERGLGRPNDQSEQTPLLGGGRVTSGRAATPAEAAARRATEPGLRRREPARRLGWFWEDTWRSFKRWLHEWKAFLIAAVIGIAVVWGLVCWQKDTPIALCLFEIFSHTFLSLSNVFPFIKCMHANENAHFPFS
ncbi:MAG: hypothetical protein JOS17DRAFT_159691 [Linnemannia elongata]|nr:MAG: hypothetical protein JOS17DRAFT_159691 [Linnemannia elongata]